MSFNSYDDMVEDLEREMRRVSDDILLQMFRMSSASGEVWSPRIDVYETSRAVVIKVCAAGLHPDEIDLTISADNRHLTLRGLRSDHDEDKSDRIRYHQLEVYYGPFERTISLPPDIPIDRERLSAAYRDGFLIVILPKVRRRGGPKKVQVAE